MALPIHISALPGGNHFVVLPVLAVGVAGGVAGRPLGTAVPIRTVLAGTEVLIGSGGRKHAGCGPVEGVVAEDLPQIYRLPGFGSVGGFR